MKGKKLQFFICNFSGGIKVKQHCSVIRNLKQIIEDLKKEFVNVNDPVICVTFENVF